MRILVLNQYFHPDVASTAQLLTELCEDLSARHDVTVVCGRPSYDPAEERASRGMVTEERHGRVRVLRTWSTAYPRRSLPGRLANYGTYLASSLVGALRAGRPDVVLTMTDPPVVAAAAMLVGRIRKVPFVYVNQDVFPEVGLALGYLQEGKLTATLRWLNRRLRASATRVIAIGLDMQDRLVTLGVPLSKISVIPNWTDGSLVRPLDAPSNLRRELGWGDRFVVMHSGNVGLSQDLDTVIDAAQLLRSHQDVLFAIVGEGASKAGLMREAEARGLTNVRFLPYQDKDDLSESLGAADVHLVGLHRGLAGYIVPSKVYGILAAGKPFIAAVEEGSEPDLIIREHQCGVRVEPGDAGALANAILELRDADLIGMGKWGREALESRFDRPIAARAYEELLQKTVRAS